MLQSENSKLKEDVELVQNQRSLIDTLRKELDVLRADSIQHVQNAEELSKQLALKDMIFERLRGEHEKKLSESAELKILREHLSDKNRESEAKFQLANEKAILIARENDSMVGRISDLENELLSASKKAESLKLELEETRQNLLMKSDQDNVISAEISVLRKQINEKGKKTSELEKENQDFKDQVESLQTKLQHAQQQLLSLRKIKESEDAASVSRDKYEEIYTANEDLRNQIKAIKQDRDQSHIEIDGLKYQIKSLEKTLKLKDEENEQKRQWLLIKDEEIDNLQNLRVKLEKERNYCASLKINLLEHEQLIANLKTERDELLSTVKDRKESLQNDDKLRQKTDKIIGTLEDKINNLERLNYEQKEELDNSQKAVMILTEKTENQEKELRILAQKCSLTSHQDSELKIQNQELKANFKKLKTSFEQIAQEYEAYKAKIENTISSHNPEVIELKEEIKTLKQENHVQNIMQAQDTISILTDQENGIHLMRTKLADSITENADTRKKLQSAQESIAELRQQLELKRDHIIYLESQVQGQIQSQEIAKSGLAQLKHLESDLLGEYNSLRTESVLLKGTNERLV